MKQVRESAVVVPDTVIAPSPSVFYGWWIVAASFGCLTVGINPIANLTFGVFLTPLSEEFGWSRSQAAQGISLAMLGFTLTQSLTGTLIARYGARRVILGSASLFSLGLWGISLLVHGRWSFLACTFLWGTVAGGTSPLPYGTIISRWFTLRRGLAMGMVIAGAASGGIILPPLVSYIINAYGWRTGFAVLGILSPCVIFPLASLVLRNTPEEMGLAADGSAPLERDPHAPQLALPGYSASEARASTTFWVLAVGLFVVIATLQSSAVHLVPFLLDRGVALTQAASAMSFLATGAVCGMVSSGYLVDRLAARVVAIGFFLTAAVGLVLLWVVHSWVATLATAVVLGLGLGAMLQLIPALVAWCFGMRAFGEIYGMLMTAFGLGTMTGPLLGGWLHDLSGSYRHTPLWYLVGIGGAVTLLLFIRPYVGREAEEKTLQGGHDAKHQA